MAMAVESSSSRSTASADSYIGSLISLTSKSEMRYEGVLYNINTDESSIGLRNVRSFGTEGRKKDGPQVPASEKVYEYILFRGSDIKDLQVKSSPPAQTSPPINNDPAIIQSHYPRPSSTSASFPSTVGGPPTDLSSHTPQLGHPGANFQGGLPMYQPGANMGPWGPSPPPPTAPGGGGLPMPMYWQGYNFPPNGLPQLPQQSLLRPPPSLSMPPLQQPIQYPGFNPSLPIGTSNFPGLNLPENPSPMLPSTTGSLNSATISSPALASQSNLPPVSIALAHENFQSLVSNKASSPILSTVPLSANLPALPPLTTSSTNANHHVTPTSNQPNASSVSTLSYPIKSQPISSIGVGSSISPTETSTPLLVTPGQLLHSAPAAAVSALQPPQTAHKGVEVVEVSSSSIEPSAPVAVEAQPPLLPLPQSSRAAAHKSNGAPYQGRPAYRGRERGGRGPGFSRPVTKFTEDFDFTAMNEKFNKDEVWGHLGKSNRPHKEGEEGSDEDDYEDEDYSEASKVEAKSVYNKDDFFDSISSNALDRESNAGRIRFSEQRKIDTETFGDFSRYRGGRGGHWHGGGRYRGSYRGRGYGGGYAVRGGGRGMSNRDF